MILEEKRINLFEVDDKFYFAHCISADFAMGAGIAVQFNKKFGMKSKLLKMWQGQTPDYPQAILVGRVFNLVTKSKYYAKPTYFSIETAISEMKEICVQEDIKYLAMPKIGCGLDRLSWGKVREILCDTFKDTDIEILVCSL